MKIKIPSYLFVFPMAVLLLSMLWGYIGIAFNIETNWLSIFIGFFIALIGSIFNKALGKRLSFILQLSSIISIFFLAKYILHMYYYNEVLYEGFSTTQTIRIYIIKLLPEFFNSFLNESGYWFKLTDVLWLLLMLAEILYFPRLERRFAGEKIKAIEKQDYIEKRFGRGRRKHTSWLKWFE